MSVNPPAAPDISVVIPAYNAGSCLDQCLDALARQDLAPREIIVVDDGSTDGSMARAAERGVTILKTSGRRGPAEARNAGARAAHGRIVFFLDADVCAHEDAIARVAAAFADGAVDAVIGSYDDDPSSRDFLSQYKNLMHHFVHQTARSEASTFWSGCGAVRREVFLEFSGFDESYKRPAIEDIELGYRLRKAGRRILLDRDLHVKHLKRWTFWNLLKTDVLDRGVPWTELILRDQNLPNDLNIQISQRISIGLVYLMLGLAALYLVRWGGYFLAPFLAILFVLLIRFWADGSKTRSRGAAVMMLVVAGAIIALSQHHYMRGLVPIIVCSVPLLFIRHRESVSGRMRILNECLSWLYIVAVILVSLRYLYQGRWVLLGIVGCAALIATLNNRFYLFLAEKRGRLFAVAAFPFHLLYHFYNGVSFGIGMCLWMMRSLGGPSRPAGKPVESSEPPVDA
ncbi:MAG TPA: glycosyltransferase family 2 protein [Bryobacteraceae bacterium]|nr:glycosyltransferase family 2 protein [Bryobacteraceae bacterium]HUO29657.1 glycosyltransferase family 2 protein [Bryobacteraceae bacterium]